MWGHRSRWRRAPARSRFNGSPPPGAASAIDHGSRDVRPCVTGAASARQPPHPLRPARHARARPGSAGGADAPNFPSSARSPARARRHLIVRPRRTSRATSSRPGRAGPDSSPARRGRPPRRATAPHALTSGLRVLTTSRSPTSSSEHSDWMRVSAYPAAKHAGTAAAAITRNFSSGAAMPRARGATMSVVRTSGCDAEASRRRPGLPSPPGDRGGSMRLQATHHSVQVTASSPSRAANEMVGPRAVACRSSSTSPQATSAPTNTAAAAATRPSRRTKSGCSLFIQPVSAACTPRRRERRPAATRRSAGSGTCPRSTATPATQVTAIVAAARTTGTPGWAGVGEWRAGRAATRHSRGRRRAAPRRTTSRSPRSCPGSG